MKRHILLYTIAAFILSLAVALPSGSVLADEAPILVSTIEVEGNKIVSKSTILTKIKTRPGDVLSQETVDEDIKRLFATGFFIDVSADIREVDGGQLVRFKVQERPLVDTVVITGNRHFRETKIRDAINTKEQELLDRRELKQDLDRIKKLYQTKGFYLAEVSQEVKVNTQEHKATIFLNITEGSKVKVRGIEFEGNENVSDRKLAKTIATKRAKWWFTSGYYRPEVLEEDMSRVELLYRAMGYSDAQASFQTTFDEDKRGLTVKIFIQEGALYLVGNVDYRGMFNMGPETFQEELQLIGDQPFSEEKLYRDVTEIQSAYFSKGYMGADVNPETLLNPQTKKIDITFNIREGEISYVGRVRVNGNIKTKDAVIRRELRVVPGERFDGEALRRSKQRLQNLGYFEEVNFETVPTDKADVRDLVVSVKETKTGEFSFGGGFSSVDSFIGFAEISQRNFDLTNWPSFVGAGQELRFRVLAGDSRRNFELSFTEPWMFGRPYLGGFDLFKTTRTTGEGFSFEQNREGGAIRLGHRFEEYNAVNMRYRFERVKISDISSSASQALQDELGTNDVSAIQFGFTRDTRDNVFNPREGYRLNSTIELAGGPLSGDKDFWKWIGTGSIFFEPFVKDQVLELKTTLGFTGEYDDSATVPIFERFFAGGSETIRGYKERRVGPKDSITNDPVGGESLLVMNAEYVVPVIDFLKVAGFVDAGNVWADTGDIGEDDLKVGAGAGVRVKTPFGPVKLDYGWPFNPDDGEKDTGRVHFSASRTF